MGHGGATAPQTGRADAVPDLGEAPGKGLSGT